MTLRDSLADAAPPAGLDEAAAALWYAGKGDWDRAHAIVQAHEGEPSFDLVHAWLHRQEGDAGNAAYWYRRAGRPVGSGPLEAEWDAIALALRATRP